MTPQNDACILQGTSRGETFLSFTLTCDLKWPRDQRINFKRDRWLDFGLRPFGHFFGKFSADEADKPTSLIGTMTVLYTHKLQNSYPAILWYVYLNESKSGRVTCGWVLFGSGYLNLCRLTCPSHMSCDKFKARKSANVPFLLYFWLAKFVYYFSSEFKLKVGVVSVHSYFGSLNC